jgi:hypothetical protein
MNDVPLVQDRAVLLTIQNSTKPEQVIYLVYDRSKEHFETEGLRGLFGVKEIKVDRMAALASLEEYAKVLSFLLETMSAALDLKLPYGYQNEFDFNGARYSIYEEGDYRFLKRLG